MGIHPSLDFDSDARALVHERGHASVWDYLRANPGVPMTELANALGGPPARVLEGHAIEDALARRELPELLCDLVLRDIHYDMRNQLRDRKDIFTGEIREKIADGEPFTFRLHITPGLPNPYRRVQGKMWDIFRSTPPPRNWKPMTPDDPLLRSVYDQAVAGLSAQDQSAIARRETLPEPGDIYRAAIGRYDVRIHDGPGPFLTDFAKVPPQLGHVLAAHWCQSKVRKDGLSELLWSSMGVLAPEAAAGLAAIGMPRSAEIVRKAMSFLGTSYPRRRWWRTIALVRARKRATELEALSHALIKELREEASGFDVAADAYASAHTKPM